jgi:hypothetical protein
LYYSVSSAPTPNATVIWQLQAGSVNPDLPASDASTGWDSLDFKQTEDAAPSIIPQNTGYSNLAKTQTWTAKYSSTFDTWYFGSGVTTNNDLSGDPLWRFTFRRGSSSGNGESYAGSLSINGVSINYTAQ